MSAGERREPLNRLQALLLHLPNYQYQPERRGKSRLLTVNHQRTAIERLLEQSPSLEQHLFPVSCPYRLEEILDEDWLPGD